MVISVMCCCDVLVDDVVVDYGFYKLEVKTKTASSVEFTTNVSSNHDSGKFLGTLETKYKWKDYGKSLFTFLSLNRVFGKYQAADVANLLVKFG